MGSDGVNRGGSGILVDREFWDGQKIQNGLC
jgi:hypothetical protein